MSGQEALGIVASIALGGQTLLLLLLLLLVAAR